MGCITTQAVTITEPTPLTNTLTKNDAICNGSCDGDATATPAGGTGPYTYLWSTVPAQTNATANTLCAGSYDVTVTDNNGCIATGSVTIAEPVAIILTMSFGTSHCGQADGQASVTPSNGQSPYTYLWNDLNNQTTSTATGLVAGNYTVTVSDLSGCSAIDNITVSDTTGPTSVISNTIDVTCFGGNNGEITVSVTDGTPPYSFLWDDANAQTTGTATGLAAGSYSVMITDLFGCITTASGTMNGPTALIASITASSNVNCNAACDGNATATANGGTPPYSYLWDNAQTTPIASGFCAGTYGVTITDNNGCQDSTTVTITEPTVLNVVLSNTDASCANVCDATGTATPNGGTTPYTYSWNTLPAQTTATATGARPRARRCLPELLRACRALPNPHRESCAVRRGLRGC